jgi:hypothetical protein
MKFNFANPERERERERELLGNTLLLCIFKILITFILSSVIVFAKKRYFYNADTHKIINYPILFLFYLLFTLTIYKIFGIDFVKYYKLTLKFKLLYFECKYNNILFILIILFLSFIPVSKINRQDVLELPNENRNANRYMPLKIKSKMAKRNNKMKLLNDKFGIDFNKWFSDRFEKRDELLYLRDMFVASDGIESATFIKLTGTTLYDSYYDYFNSLNIKYHYDNLKLEKVNESLQKFNNFCEAKGIKCYVMIAPHKAQFIKNNKTQKNNFVKEYKLPVINPYSVLEEANKTEGVFYKVDWHLNQYGSFQVWKLLLDNIRKDFSDLPRVKEPKYIYGKYDNKDDISEKYESKLHELTGQIYRYYEPTKSRRPKYKKNIMIIGSSFADMAGLPAMREVFENTYVFVNNKRGINVQLYKTEIEEKKIDILVIYLNNARIGEFENFMESIENLL